MTIKELIDGGNNDVYISVLSVSYPLTTKNVFEKDCFFSLEIEFQNFRKYNPSFFEDPQLVFKTGDIHLPDGIYTISLLIDFLNSYLEQYGVKFVNASYGKIVVNSYMYCEYWIKQHK